jgi:multiple sugar transport system permease protein
MPQAPSATGPAAAVPVASPARRRLERWLDSEAIWPVMVAATVLYLAIFIGYPVLYNLVMSMQEVNVGNLRSMDRPFVGLANYVKLVDDPLFWTVTRNTAIFVVVNVSVQCVGGLLLAMYFAQNFPGAGWLRGLILAGWMLPPLVIGAVWKWMLTSDNGIVNHALQWLGITGGKIYWLSDPNVALGSVTAANIWFGVPFNMILIAAGLAGIPRDIHEAAALDGAGAVRRFFSITLPLLAPTLYALVALTTVYTMRAFDLIWTMTHGGPVDASNIFPVWSYRLSFEVFDFGAGAAISTAMLFIVFLVALVYVRSVRAEKRF